MNPKTSIFTPITLDEIKDRYPGALVMLVQQRKGPSGPKGEIPWVKLGHGSSWFYGEKDSQLYRYNDLFFGLNSRFAYHWSAEKAQWEGIEVK